MVTNDYHALSIALALWVPWMKWDGQTSVTQARQRMKFDDLLDRGTAERRALVAVFQAAWIEEYYADFVQHGEEVHVRTHFGEERANAAARSNQAADAMAKILLGALKDSMGEEGVREAKRRMQNLGRDDLMGVFDSI